MSDIYCQLIPNDDPNEPYYQVMPRMGAFEVSINGVVSSTVCFNTNYDNFQRNYPLQTFFILNCINLTMFYFIQLLFSKCLSGLWPHYGAIAQRAE